METTESTEIRKLPWKHRYELIKILNDMDDWKLLMSKIPERLTENSYNCKISEDNLPRYTDEHMRIIQDAAKEYGRSPTDILFDEWGCTGLVQPTLGHLFYLLKDLKIIRAADYIANLLKKNIPTRPLEGPAAVVKLNADELKILEEDTIHSKIQNELDQNQEQSRDKENIPALSKLLNSDTTNIPKLESSLVNNSVAPSSVHLLYDYSKHLYLHKTIVDPFPNVKRRKDKPGQSLSLTTSLMHIAFEELKEATNNFNENPVDLEKNEMSIGRFLGKGGYGSVYLALGLNKIPEAAVKKFTLDKHLTLEDSVLNSIKREIEICYQFQHENLIKLLAYSCDGPNICLVYEYISGGNLKNRLEENPEKLSWQDRLSIASDISKAIYYLHHSNPEHPYIHRDVKSANVLLDAYKRAKLCDFGIARLTTHTTSHTMNVLGTSPYMSPEGARGDISLKIDVFSFGVLLLELLTGWAPFDINRSSIDLLTFVKEELKKCNNNFGILLDKKAGDWTQDGSNLGLELFNVSRDCVKNNKTDRPCMFNVVESLGKLLDRLKMKESRQNEAYLPDLSNLLAI